MKVLQALEFFLKPSMNAIKQVWEGHIEARREGFI